jgi:hypothetical protein
LTGAGRRRAPPTRSRARPTAHAENQQRSLDERLIGILQDAIERPGRGLLGDGAVEGRRQAVDVGPGPLLGRAELLGRGVTRRQDRRQLRGASQHGRTGRAKVDQGWPSGRVQQDVRGLDVTVKESGHVHVLEPVEQRPQDGVDLGIGERGASQLFLQRLTAQQFHDDVGRAVFLEVVEHAHDGRRLVQAGKRAAFLDEAFATPDEIVGDGGRERQHRRAALPDGKHGRQVLLDGNVAIELRVAGPVGDAETALAQYRDNLVSADLAARHQRYVVDRCRGLQGLLVSVAHTWSKSARHTTSGRAMPTVTLRTFFADYRKRRTFSSKPR